MIIDKPIDITDEMLSIEYLKTNKIAFYTQRDNELEKQCFLELVYDVTNKRDEQYFNEILFTFRYKDFPFAFEKVYNGFSQMEASTLYLENYKIIDLCTYFSVYSNYKNKELNKIKLISLVEEIKKISF